LKCWDRGKDSHLKGAFDKVFRHAIGISDDTERDVRGGRPIQVLGGGAELVKRQIR
jgi:hypothetical protein